MMSDKAVPAKVLFDVVLDDGEQYSPWLAGKELPSGVKKAGMQASQEACLNCIKDVRTDMRALSFRQPMAGAVGW
jgi:uncharacterized protein YbdZ (MbtH family)